MHSIDDSYSLIWENRRKEAGVSDNRLYIDGKGYDPVSKTLKSIMFKLYGGEYTGILSGDNVADITSIHDELDTSEHDIWLENLTTVGTWENSPEYGNDYTFICFPAPDMVLNGDYYSQAEVLLANRSAICAAIIAAIVLSGLLSAACVILYMLAAGHNKNKDGISETFLDRMPMEASAFVFAVTAFFPFFAVEETINTESIIYYAVLAIALVIMFVSIILWLGTVAVNVKKGQFWKNTIVYKLFIKGMIRWGREFRFVFKNLKMGVRVWLIFAAVTFAEMFCLAWFDVEEGFIWLIEKVLVIILIHKILKQFAVLKNTALSIAAGDVTEPVDTSKMLIDLEEQGNALNIIRTGMNEAMDARIKSERLKTELITNVSHDIKTPLTSIINYVDLMQKEKTDNEKINEYLEVLDRQSGKLKKLIEDLIEASKAATGNIKMQMEDVNARVLLNQSIGEFEERLEQKNIKLVTEVPEEDIHIQADSRYLWRVLDNLMNNIVKYSQEGTRAYVDLKQLGDHVRFVFRNTSRDELNISADELMERFVRGDASRNTDGNGLGLSIASSLTEAMGGKLTLSIDGDLFKATVEF